MTDTLYEIPVHRIDGTPATLAEFKQHVVLIVNVASKCGLTKQYDGLEKLYEKYRDRGLVVAGFPANDFAQQEPGSNGEIQEFCRADFGVEFPLFEKITVVGDRKHPLYRVLTEAQPTAESTSALGRAFSRTTEKVREDAQSGARDPLELREVSGEQTGHGREAVCTGYPARRSGAVACRRGSASGTVSTAPRGSGRARG